MSREPKTNFPRQPIRGRGRNGTSIQSSVFPVKMGQVRILPLNYQSHTRSRDIWAQKTEVCLREHTGMLAFIKAEMSLDVGIGYFTSLCAGQILFERINNQ